MVQAVPRSGASHTDRAEEIAHTTSGAFGAARGPPRASGINSHRGTGAKPLTRSSRYIPRMRSKSGNTHQKNVNITNAHPPAINAALRPDTAAKMMIVIPVSARPSSASPA